MPRRSPRARPRRSDRPAGAAGAGRSRLALASASLAALVLVLGLGLRAAFVPSGDPVDRRAAGSAAVARPLEPIDAEGWLRRIDRLRVEDRPVDALAIGRRAYAAVPPEDRPEVLRAVTLALLADVPQDQAREALLSRIEADPEDLDARVALIRRSIRFDAPPGVGRPRVGRPSAGQPEAIAELSAILERSPGHLGAREALVDLLLDLGRIDQARSALDAWPEDRRDDHRRLRLQARLDLDHDDRPDRAAESLARLIALAPHDWRLRARLARALERSKDPEAAGREAILVDRLRERLAPDRLGARLAEDFRNLDEPSVRLDLAGLCDSVGLAELAAAWRIEADARSGREGPGGPS